MSDTVAAIRAWPVEDGWFVEPGVRRYIKLGTGVRLGNDVTLGTGVRLGDDVTLGDGVGLGNWVTLGNDVRLGNDVTLDTPEQVICVGPIGSRRGTLCLYREQNKPVMVTTGCFSGTWDEFRAAVERTHAPDSPHRRAYQLVAPGLHAMLSARSTGEAPDA